MLKLVKTSGTFQRQYQSLVFLWPTENPFEIKSSEINYVKEGFPECFAGVTLKEIL